MKKVAVGFWGIGTTLLMMGIGSIGAVWETKALETDERPMLQEQEKNCEPKSVEQTSVEQWIEESEKKLTEMIGRYATENSSTDKPSMTKSFSSANLRNDRSQSENNSSVNETQQFDEKIEFKSLMKDVARKDESPDNPASLVKVGSNTASENEETGIPIVNADQYVADEKCMLFPLKVLANSLGYVDDNGYKVIDLSYPSLHGYAVRIVV